MSLPPIDDVLVSLSPGELRVAMLRERRLCELHVARASRAELAGSIFVGRVRRVMPGLDAAFVDIGVGHDAFLGSGAAEFARPGSRRKGSRRRGIATRVSEGEAVRVQVVAEALGDKGPVVTTRIALPGRRLVYTPGSPGISSSRRIPSTRERGRLKKAIADLAGPGDGFILRTAAAGFTAGVLTTEAKALKRLWREVERRCKTAAPMTCVYREPSPLIRILRDHIPGEVGSIRFDSGTTLMEARRYAQDHAPELLSGFDLYTGREPLFAHADVEGQIEAALRRRVPLPSGGALTIDSMGALTAIDVDTASAVGRDPSTRPLQTNLEAASEAARQIRLRNIAGPIVIDFLRLHRRVDQGAVIDELKQAFADDPMQIQIADFSALGLVEMTRQRGRESLTEIMIGNGRLGADADRSCNPETVALEALRAVLRQTAAAPGGRPILIAAPAVVAALGAGGPAAAALTEVESRLGGSLVLRAREDLPPDRYEVVIE